MIEVIWYTRDLRIRDHAPLVHATTSDQVLPFLHTRAFFI
jgi:deoxyribodipyrimidine photolyase